MGHGTFGNFGSSLGWPVRRKGHREEASQPPDRPPRRRGPPCLLPAHYRPLPPRPPLPPSSGVHTTLPSHAPSLHGCRHSTAHPPSRPLVDSRPTAQGAVHTQAPPLTWPDPTPNTQAGWQVPSSTPLTSQPCSRGPHLRCPPFPQGAPSACGRAEGTLSHALPRSLVQHPWAERCLVCQPTTGGQALEAEPRSPCTRSCTSKLLFLFHLRCCDSPGPPAPTGPADSKRGPWLPGLLELADLTWGCLATSECFRKHT